MKKDKMNELKNTKKLREQLLEGKALALFDNDKTY